jgi:2'-5' RNA ligase
MRLFIALELDTPLKHQLSRLIEQLRTDAAKVRWVAAENMHLTLKFLGEVPDGDVRAVCRVVDQVAAASAPVEFDVAGVGAFPGTQSPRIVWAGLPDAPEGLVRIAQELDNAYGELGYRREGRRFQPHLTLGRVSSVRDRQAFARRLEDYADWSADAPQYCDELVAVSSELTRDGPIYTAIHRAKLAMDA